MDKTSIRDPWWDNTRFVSATLIVVLHTIGSIMSQHDVLHAFNLATWAYRVPAFVVLAGVFSSAGPLTAKYLRGMIQNIAVPGALCGLLYSTEQYFLGNGFTLHVSQLPWALWFLMSLFCWRLLLPLVVQLRYPLLITTTAALGLGYFTEFGLRFSASRTIVYLPLFYIGYRIGQGALNRWFASRWSLPVSIAGVLAAAVSAWVWNWDIKGSWLSLRHTYRESDPMPMELAWLIRLAVLAIALALVICMLRLIPRRRLPGISVMGSRGYTIYLLHPLVLLPVRESGLIDRVNRPVEQVGLVLCGVLLTLVLASAPVRFLSKPLIRPPVGWLFAQEPPRHKAETPRAPQQVFMPAQRAAGPDSGADQNFPPRPAASG